jgi:hypothetical protein
MPVKMAMNALGGQAADRPVKKATFAGIALLLSFWAVYCIIYALSYPISDISGEFLFTVALGSAWADFFLVLSVIGLALTVVRRRDYSRNDVLVSLLFGVLVGAAYQSRYWFTGVTPPIAFYAPAFYGIETFLMALGAIGLLKASPVLRLRLAEREWAVAGRSLLLGAVLGIPFAALNVLLNQRSGLRVPGLYDVAAGSFVALLPAILEETAFRLLFLGLALAILARFLPWKTAVCSAILMSVVFHMAPHVPDMIASNPASALVSILIMSIVYGLPITLLAYKRDVETAMGFHWVIDAVKFTILGF